MSSSERKTTALEHRILRSVDQLSSRTGYNPTPSEIRRDINIKTPATIEKHIVNLKQRGLLQQNEITTVVCLTDAGMKFLKKHSADRDSTIIVSDNEMVASGILPGDEVEICRDFPICNGMLVVAKVRNKKICRKLAVKGTRFWLYTEDAPEKATEVQFQDIEGAVSKVQRLYYHLSA